MNRQQAIRTLQIIAGNFAKRCGYTQMQVSEDRQKGIWGERLTRYLEEKYGECTADIKWFKPGNDKDYVQFRFRFDNPVISIHFRDETGRETLANLEFTCSRYVDTGKVYEKDEGYYKKGDTKYERVDVPCELNEVMLWNPKVARQYARRMERMWNYQNKKL